MSQIRVITVEREYGCGGGKIAQQLAERLGWKLWDQLLTCEIARLADCERSLIEKKEERVDPLYYRLFKSILRGSFEGSLHLQRVELLDCDSILRFSRQIIEKAAAEGKCVIVGRGSQNFLSERADTLRVFLYAPREAKVRRLIADGISAKEAEAAVDSVDAERAAFIQKYFQREWPSRALYHAMLNTESGEDQVIDTILGLKRQIEDRSRQGSSPPLHAVRDERHDRIP